MGGTPFPEFYVTGFGARGNGTDDDTYALNNAMQSLPAGETLHFPLGTYKTTTGLQLIPGKVVSFAAGATITASTAGHGAVEITQPGAYQILGRGTFTGANGQSGVKIYAGATSGSLYIEGGASVSNSTALAVSVPISSGPTLPFPRPRIVVATHADCGQGNNNAAGDNGLSDGIITTETSRRNHTFQTSCRDVRLIFGNWVCGDPGVGESTATPDSITVKCGFEDSLGNIWKVTFGGSQTVALAAGAYVISDAVPREFVAGDTAWSRVNVTVASGKKFPLNSGHWGIVSGEAVEAGVDFSYSGTVTGGGFAYSALAIVGISTAAVQPSVICGIGDSIMYGNLAGTVPGGSVLNNTPSQGTGFLLRALGYPWGLNAPCINLGFSGDTMQNLATYSLSPLRILMTQLAGSTHVVCNMGFNDVFNNGRTAAQLIADMQKFWNRINVLGLPIWQSTIPPKSQSSDNFATAANIAQASGTLEAIRQTVNAFIRTVPTPLAGIIEIADAVEPSRNAGVHKTTGVTYGYTADGTHFSQGGDIAAAAIINPAMFQ